MSRKHSPNPKRRNYPKLGSFLRKSRAGQPVKDIAKHLHVTRGFVYQVEQGIRKPKDRDIGQWASVYGVKPNDLWLCLYRIPMDYVQTLKDKPKPTPVDPFSQLTDEEKEQLLPFVEFIRWKLSNKAFKSKDAESLSKITKRHL
jgi:transcriptional regulator with XRE-family HTH domain